jgi:anaerobic magnesium-protoporphyrin IX monomethyl ester cyclase
MTKRGNAGKRVLLLEACREPSLPREDLVLRSHILGGMSIRRVVEGSKRFSGESVQRGVSTTSLFGIPMGLAYVASGIDRDRFEILHMPLIIDAYGFRLSRKRFVDEVSSLRPDAVGMTLNHTADRGAALGMCRDLKRVCGDMVTVLGGVEATFGGAKIMDHEAVDCVVSGEGDIRFGLLLSRLFFGNGDVSDIPGLRYRSGPRTCYTGDPGEHVDLGPLSPLYEPMLPKRYMEAGILAHVQTSRGCPYACSFCCHTAFWGRRMRYRRPASVIAEIEYLAGLGAEIAYFSDSTFTMNRDHVTAILQGLRDGGFRPPVLVLETRMELIDRALCGLLRDAGVGIVAMGVECGDEHVLRKTGGKGCPDYADRVRRAHGLLKEAGIEMYASLVVGLPGESARSHDATMRLVRLLHKDGLMWADAKLAMAFPGSDLTENPGRHGVRLTETPAYLFYDRPGFTCEGGPDEHELLAMHREIVALNVEQVMKKPWAAERRNAIEAELVRIRSTREAGQSDWYD